MKFRSEDHAKGFIQRTRVQIKNALQEGVDPFSLEQQLQAAERFLKDYREEEDGEGGFPRKKLHRNRQNR